MFRRGYTLVELLLVLAILVVLAAAAAPALMGVMQDQRLKSAADEVRIAWTRAHVKAMKTGRIQVFRYELGGEKYVVQPWAATDEVLAATGTELTPFASSSKEEDSGPRLDESAAVTLPEGIRFIIGDAQAESRSVRIEQQIQDANRFEGNWSRPILFYPDGSATEAFLILANEREAGIEVQLRAMTGAATVGGIISLKDVAN